MIRRLALRAAMIPMVFLLLAGVSSAQRVDHSYPALGTVTGKKVRLRTGPSLNHFPFTTLSLGTKILVDGREGEWYRILLPPYVHCWIHGDYVSARGAGQVVVTGTKVKIRATAGVRYSELGLVVRGRTLDVTGKRDKTGKWLECSAPQGIHAYISKDYVQLGSKVSPAEVPVLVRGLQPPDRNAPVNPGGKEAPPVAGQTPFQLPRAVSPRLAKVYARFTEETTNKDPLQWNLAPILADLARIRAQTEDVGEAQVAQVYIKYIRDHWLPIHQAMVELEKKKDEARGEVASSDKKARIKRAVHREKNGAGDEFLATGWIVPTGRHGKVDATHKLVKGNQTLYLLRSDQIDLDKYVNKRVGVQGILQEVAPAEGARMIVVTAIKLYSK